MGVGGQMGDLKPELWGQPVGCCWEPDGGFADTAHPHCVWLCSPAPCFLENSRGAT